MPYTRITALKRLLKSYMREEEEGSEKYLRLASQLESLGASEEVVSKVEKMADDEEDHGVELEIILDELKVGRLFE